MGEEVISGGTTRPSRRLGRPPGGRLLAAGPIAIAMILSLTGPVAAADPVSFGSPTSSSAFGKSIEFVQPVTLAAAPTLVELLLQTPGAAGPNVVEVPPPTTGGTQTLRFSTDLTQGHIYPNTLFTARWRVTDTGGKTWLGPEVKHLYADDRLAWQTVEGKVVRAHWYEGDAAFGRKVLQIGDNAIADTSKLLGVTESEPIDFYVYADQSKFYDALGPGARENVGGEAHADIRTMFALITPADINAAWVETVVPHELTHLVFATAIANPYHEPPHWLNEGLAVYLSEGYAQSYRNSVSDAIHAKSIIPLAGLAGAFPTTYDRFLLGYGESVSAVDFIVRTYGRDALVGLIRSYAKGVSDDEAFSTAFGVDTAGFEAAWLKDLGASAPVRLGPVPAPVGPLPSGWAGPLVIPSVVPALPGGATAGVGAASPANPGATGDTAPVVFVLLGVLVVLIVAGILVGRRRQAARRGPW
jgi:LPXTG-motif cell wall-anchored protein